VICGTDRDRIKEGIKRADWPEGNLPQIFGDGRASEKIAALIESRI
jgi:hypothetical protein